MVNAALLVDNGSPSAPLLARLIAGAGWTPLVTPVERLPRRVPPVSAVILSGTDVPVWLPVYAAEVRLIRSCPVPLLGVCGGHQLIGRAHGVGLRRVPPALGRTRVRLHGDHPLWTGLPPQVELFQRHVYGLRAVPAGFDLIATSGACPVEGIARTGGQVYGMQAHLEFRPEGRAILSRFLDLAAPTGPVSWCTDDFDGQLVDPEDEV
ncbi:type 1 glutamine amidotransferase [Dactylosporangium salmoneum]|uniref:Glutamine amidotransferase domain-containing protein n=1 Tax=Dactylosporangium salmoneum TaxID=53361 RepID=A0ABN3FXY5_9ACTN